jgi:triosephosphate isomerase
VAKRLEDGPVAVAAQDCFWEIKGAFTGEVSAPQLVDVGCKYVIVGHSERRQLMGELDAAVNLKARAALRAGLCPIICIGETLAERDAGETIGRIGAQLDAAIADMSEADLERVVIAYEPVWAIGTGRNATPAQAEEVHRFIRTRVAARAPAVAPGLRILYGGSVKPENIAALMAEADVDGGLVGGASLSAESFIRIVQQGRKPGSPT